jgi:glucose/arabinose dehydrogenase
MTILGGRHAAVLAAALMATGLFTAVGGGASQAQAPAAAQPGGNPPQADAPSAGRGQRGGGAAGRGGRAGRAGGVPPQPAWGAPPLPAGPLPLETAEYRNLRVVVLARGLNNPWSIAFLPDGNMLVTERPGRIRIIRNGVLDPVPVAGGPSPVYARGLQGLMDIVLHPNFEQNKWVYISYHRPVANPLASAAPGTPAPTAPNAGATTLARGVWDGNSITSLQDIFQTTATGTESSRIGFARDGMLHMSVSAQGDERLTWSQDPNHYAGKTVRLRDDGTIPPDNPFVGREGYLPGIFTLGHRNNHSMQLNPETGEFWATEQGPNGGDEINILRAGRNYGWPVISYGRAYAGPKISENPYKEGMEQPVVYWVPSIAVTGMTFYTGETFPKWKRNVFVTGLRQGEVARTGQLQRIEFNEKWEEIRREPLLRALAQRMRDVRQGPDGLLYVLTGETNDGAVLRIEPAEGPSGVAR